MRKKSTSNCTPFESFSKNNSSTKTHTYKQPVNTLRSIIDLASLAPRASWQASAVRTFWSAVGGCQSGMKGGLSGRRGWPLSCGREWRLSAGSTCRSGVRVCQSSERWSQSSGGVCHWSVVKGCFWHSGLRCHRCYDSVTCGCPSLGSAWSRSSYMCCCCYWRVHPHWGCWSSCCSWGYCWCWLCAWTWGTASPGHPQSCPPSGLIHWGWLCGLACCFLRPFGKDLSEGRVGQIGIST